MKREKKQLSANISTLEVRWVFLFVCYVVMFFEMLNFTFARKTVSILLEGSYQILVCK